MQGYEERFYPSTMWVCTIADKHGLGYQKLERYMSGRNERRTTIEMSVPKMKIHGVVYKYIELCLYVTGNNPPKPTDTKVYLRRWREMTGYANSIGGFPNMVAEAR